MFVSNEHGKLFGSNEQGASVRLARARVSTDRQRSVDVQRDTNPNG